MSDVRVLATSGWSARKLGVAIGRVLYAISKHNLEPIAMAGRTRIYRQSDLELIAWALGEIAQRKRVR